MSIPDFFDDLLRPEIRIIRRYPYPVERVWRAVTDPADLIAWFPAEVEYDPIAGSSISFGQDDWQTTGEVIEFRSPNSFRFSWDTDELAFEIEPDAVGSQFTLIHRFHDRTGAASFATGWEACLDALSARLDGNPAPAPDRRVERHEELIAAFGLDVPAISHHDLGWTIRWERQLTAPAEAIWNIFFGLDAGVDQKRSTPVVGELFRPFAAPDVVLGTVTESDPPRRFAFTTAASEPGERVSFELGQGTGHGARLHLTVSGTSEDEIEDAIDQWGDGAIAHIARAAADR